jgi:hypothetical protein
MQDNEKGALIQVLESMKVLPKPEDVERELQRMRARAGKSNGDNPNGAQAKQLSRRVVTATTRRMTGIGAVAALPAVIPGVGTAAQAAITGTTLTGEMWLLLRNLTSMQLTVAGLHGHDIRHPDRRDELVVVWGLETGAIVPAAEAVERIGTKVAIKQFNQRVSGEVFMRINRKLGTTVLTKWGTKRGGVAVGRLIPFGVGSAVGGGMNYLAARSFGAALIRYYSDLAPANAPVFVD